MELIRQGDSQSLEEALALLQNTVFSFRMKVCGQRQDAEDTMQEVLLQSAPNLPKFDSPKARTGDLRRHFNLIGYAVID